VSGPKNLKIPVFSGGAAYDEIFIKTVEMVVVYRFYRGVSRDRRFCGVVVLFCPGLAESHHIE